MAILFALLSVGVFLGLTLGAHVNFFASAGIAVALFTVLVLLNHRHKKFGNLVIDDEALSQRLETIDLSARKSLLEIQKTASRMRNYRKETNHLVKLGKQILSYVESDPTAMSKSEHFLEYYFPMLQKILQNYVSLSGVMLEPTKREQIEAITQESLEYLDTIFQKQLDGYHNNKILEIEAQSDLLEKTAKLGGDL
ncbi:MAG: 5-bromo-4-chloroindolyl phosphate hydrolysis family protein [Mobiluncus porci]|uniref:5-bromo-4-chloroindolyl phosphate hydrolysis protein n=1 Tax=Mobiluncus porci TaxID=2652278 RepID=A0A7K0K143_9ACTO|nr:MULTISPECIES: 5-bromo-4-chloroindolyl phosphate hydrolysis family protein [Mobiluncus]MCI6585279.1 5-bromo-4-chloroindolyl phosphate hydrolysis family protein [Mobiluncus sp.]MDD7541510.1 5-bromo-4-chloroindolyl phosphate hydrolysis family protein [Mobiluncus porci]MDY5748495.1 5-bromo-4-chloroindolyl phosphate hydrolysis family protein [Mobiluncus porci]MST48745.1 hypothetical protein [Mobiluncus porci]